jgi:tetratricopeptide (TPR) repeat protein
MKIWNKLMATASIALTIVLTISSCSTTMNTAELQRNAESAFAAGEYAKALQQYENLIESWNNSKENEQNPYYDKAGHAAFALKDYEKANNYFSQAMHYGTATPATYTELIGYYREINNFSREMMTLEGMVETFPEKAAANGVHERLFEMYVETDRWEDAALQAKKFNPKSDEILLEKLLEMHSSLGNKAEADDVAGQLLALNGDNIPALEWRAKKYYDKAEARYKAEAEAYDRNKTRRQYAQLLEGYEAAGVDYRKARDIYERLYKRKPEKRYALYLYNIYARFQDEAKAAYYRSRM